MSKILDEALVYEANGLSVIPVHTVSSKGACSCGSASCKSPGKHPSVLWRGNQSRRMTADELRAALSGKSNNIGIITGPVSGIVVIDIDGPEGIDSLKAAGLGIEALPETPMVKTGGGGFHLYYRYPESEEVKTQTAVLKKVDVRALGGFVVAPPSMHKSGKKYEWAEGRSLSEIPIADMSEALMTLLRTGMAPGETIKPKARSPGWWVTMLGGVASGERNQSATRLAGRYLAMGLSDAEILWVLDGWNSQNDPPMPQSELITIIKSVAKTVKEKKVGRNLEWISEKIGVNVTRIRRITGDSPLVIMEFDEGKASMNTRQLLSPIEFQMEVASATKRVIPKLTSKTIPTHAQLVQAIMDMSVDEDAGQEATWDGELGHAIRAHIAAQRAHTETSSEGPVPMVGTFRRDGRVWISIGDLFQRMSALGGGKRVSNSQMAQGMRALGMEPKKFVDTSGSTRTMWGLLEEGL